jgi:signal transduction histidine kinase
MNQLQNIDFIKSYKSLVKFSRASSSINDETELARQVCKLVVQELGYDYAWFGYTNNGNSTPIVQAQSYGQEANLLMSAWNYNELSDHPVDQAVKTCRLVTRIEVPSETQPGQWSEFVRQNNISLSLALPVMNTTHAIGVLSVHSVQPNYYPSPEELEILEELAKIFAYRIRVIRTEKENLLLKGKVNEYVRNAENPAQVEDKTELCNKLKAEFLSQISHEIRTPITTVLSNYYYIKDLLEEKNLLNNELVSAINNIDKGGRRIIRTVELMLGMAELNTGTYVSTKDKIDLFSNVVEELYHEYKNITSSQQLQIVLLKNTSDTKIVTDGFAVKQILQQVIDNAVKFTDSGSVTISVNRTPEKELEIVVEDTGIGISEEFMPSLFELFTQEGSGYSRRYDGNGLGLAFVKKMSELIGVKIFVTSKKGIGTKFILNFPK